MAGGRDEQPQLPCSCGPARTSPLPRGWLPLFLLLQQSPLWSSSHSADLGGASDPHPPRKGYLQPHNSSQVRDGTAEAELAVSPVCADFAGSRGPLRLSLLLPRLRLLQELIFIPEAETPAGVPRFCPRGFLGTGRAGFSHTWSLRAREPRRLRARERVLLPGSLGGTCC